MDENGLADRRESSDLSFAYEDIMLEAGVNCFIMSVNGILHKFKRHCSKKQDGMVKQWRDKKGNIRDYASINELICLSNMKNINAVTD